ncbi:MAG: leucine-rich repeat domain-containing protein, partial [Lachnospiraceae bacterium]|nr:leucine-rich repeat domain-containing protein [Lachnospiraceae bacterium]
MKKNFKRIIAIILAITMLFGLLPADFLMMSHPVLAASKKEIVTTKSEIKLPSFSVSMSVITNNSMAILYSVQKTMKTSLNNLMLLETTAVEEENNSCGDNATYTLENGVLTISGTGIINDNAFNSNKDITSVIIQEGITEIGSFSFWNCTELESVKLPESLKELKGLAFGQCTGLKEMEIPGSLEKVTAVHYDYGD